MKITINAPMIKDTIAEKTYFITDPPFEIVPYPISPKHTIDSDSTQLLNMCVMCRLSV